MFSMIIESQFLFFSNLITSPTEISIAPHTPSSCFYINSNIMREDLSQNPVGKREGGKICNFGCSPVGRGGSNLLLSIPHSRTTALYRSKQKRIILRSVQYGVSLNGLWCNGSQKRRELTFTFLIF